jgi:hypothetical protein
VHACRTHVVVAEENTRPELFVGERPRVETPESETAERDGERLQGFAERSTVEFPQSPIQSHLRHAERIALITECDAAIRVWCLFPTREERIELVLDSAVQRARGRRDFFAEVLGIALGRRSISGERIVRDSIQRGAEAQYPALALELIRGRDRSAHRNVRRAAQSVEREIEGSWQGDERRRGVRVLCEVAADETAIVSEVRREQETHVLDPSCGDDDVSRLDREPTARQHCRVDPLDGQPVEPTDELDRVRVQKHAHGRRTRKVLSVGDAKPRRRAELRRLSFWRMRPTCVFTVASPR